MVTMKHKPGVDTEEIRRRKSKHANMESHQFAKEGQQEREKKYKGTIKQPDTIRCH